MADQKQKNNLTPISDLGEFKLIEELTKTFEINNDSTDLGIGDDAAVLDFKKEKILISTDMLVEGVHFDLAYTPMKHLGYKAIISNLSDIYAMNGICTQITAVSYTHLRAHETVLDLVCRLLLEKKNKIFIF